MFVRRSTYLRVVEERDQLRRAHADRIAQNDLFYRDQQSATRALEAARTEAGDLELRAEKAERLLRKTRESAMRLEGQNEVMARQLVKLQRELASERASHAAERRRADQGQNNFEWARLTLNAAEQRAAELMAHILKSPTLTALEVGRTAPPATTGRAEAKDVLGLGVPNGDISFEDVGDEVARQEGIEWDAEGLVTYDQRNGNQQQ